MINHKFTAVMFIIAIALVSLIFYQAEKLADKIDSQVAEGLSETRIGLSKINTVQHDNHLWVVFYQGGIVHHPECECKGGEKW